MFFFFKKKTKQLKKCQKIFVIIVIFSLEIYGFSKQILMSNLYLAINANIIFLSNDNKILNK